jgi:hypothetical protein
MWTADDGNSMIVLFLIAAVASVVVMRHFLRKGMEKSGWAVLVLMGFPAFVVMIGYLTHKWPPTFPPRGLFYATIDLISLPLIPAILSLFVFLSSRWKPSWVMFVASTFTILVAVGQKQEQFRSSFHIGASVSVSLYLGLAFLWVVYFFYPNRLFATLPSVDFANSAPKPKQKDHEYENKIKALEAEVSQLKSSISEGNYQNKNKTTRVDPR